MRFACLGSGSRGNAWLVESGRTRVMLDCGFSLRETGARLQRLGLQPEDLTAIVLTHEHADHARGVARLANRLGCPVWLTHGCLSVMEAMDDMPDHVAVVDSHIGFSIGDLSLHPYPVPHDAREPVQYVLSDGNHRFGLLTDAGHVTEHMAGQLDGCDALALECNHDVEMLRQGSYPPSLKARILGRYGHLDNMSAAALLSRINTRKLQHVVAAHLSEENNTPELARHSLAGALGCSADWVGVADQAHGLGWRTIT